MGTRGIRALAALASVAAVASASHAMASQEIKITNVQMDQAYTAHITGLAEYPHGVDVYDNGTQFTATFVTGGPLGAVGSVVPDLFGFCIDVYHNINLGPQTLYYNDNQGDPNPLVTDNGGHNLLAGQITALTNLIDTGFILHTQENATNHDDTEMRLAAIQAAIWKVEVPSIGVSVNNAGHTVAGDGTSFGGWFTNYSTGNYTSLADANDRVFTITSLSDPAHQNFAVGWPIPGVPEPTTWALMLAGFGGMGAMLRRQRKAVAVTA